MTQAKELFWGGRFWNCRSHNFFGKRSRGPKDTQLQQEKKQGAKISDDEEPPPLIDRAPAANDPPPVPDQVRERNQHYGQNRGMPGLYAFREAVVGGQRQLRNILRVGALRAQAASLVVAGGFRRVEETLEGFSRQLSWGGWRICGRW